MPVYTTGLLNHREAHYMLMNFVRPEALPFPLEERLGGYLDRAYLDYTPLECFHREHDDTVMFYRADAWLKAPAGHWIRVHGFAVTGLSPIHEMSSPEVNVDICREWPFHEGMDHYPSGFSFQGSLDEALRLTPDEVSDLFTEAVERAKNKG